MVSKQIAKTMLSMAAHDPNFRVVYVFFMQLSTASKDEYLTICRSRMPHVADTLAAAWLPLRDTKIFQAMQQAHKLSDAALVQLSTVLLDMIVAAVEKTTESINETHS